jgi:hypothetical protein
MQPSSIPAHPSGDTVSNYLTPARYRQMAFGVDLSAYEDAGLRSILTRASALVNTYTAAPMLPKPHDFRGGVIDDEQHPWNVGTNVFPPTRRIYLWHRPIKSITRLTIDVTSGMHVDIGGTDIYVNNTEGYVEVTALAAVTFGIFPQAVVPNLGLLIPTARADYAYGWSFTEEGDELYFSDGYSFSSAHLAWATTPDPVIYVDGEAQDDGYTVDYPNGTIRFDTRQSADAVVTADYTYTLPAAIQEATGIIATSLIGEAELARKGMTGLSTIRVDELTLSRVMHGGGRGRDEGMAYQIPEAAMSLLDSYRFHSVG